MTGFTGATVSIRNGPRWAAALQLPALSRLRRWNHHSPSASGGLVEPETVPSASFDVSGTVEASCVQSNEKPSRPLALSLVDHATSTVLSVDQSDDCVLEIAGVVGAVASILNGPRWTAALQFPVRSTVRRWNHHEPSATAPLVVPVAVSSASLLVSGTVVALCVHSYENPSTPLPPSEAPLQRTSTVLSFDQPDGWVLESDGLLSGGVVSGPAGAAPSPQFSTPSPALYWSFRRITYVTPAVA